MSGAGSGQSSPVATPSRQSTRSLRSVPNGISASTSPGKGPSTTKTSFESASALPASNEVKAISFGPNSARASALNPSRKLTRTPTLNAPPTIGRLSGSPARKPSSNTTDSASPFKQFKLGSGLSTPLSSQASKVKPAQTLAPKEPASTASVIRSELPDLPASYPEQEETIGSPIPMSSPSINETELGQSNVTLEKAPFELDQSPEAVNPVDERETIRTSSETLPDPVANTSRADVEDETDHFGTNEPMHNDEVSVGPTLASSSQKPLDHPNDDTSGLQSASSNGMSPDPKNLETESILSPPAPSTITPSGEFVMGTSAAEGPDGGISQGIGSISEGIASGGVPAAKTVPENPDDHNKYLNKNPEVPEGVASPLLTDQVVNQTRDNSPGSNDNAESGEQAVTHKQVEQVVEEPRSNLVAAGGDSQLPLEEGHGEIEEGNGITPPLDSSNGVPVDTEILKTANLVHTSGAPELDEAPKSTDIKGERSGDNSSSLVKPPAAPSIATENADGLLAKNGNLGLSKKSSANEQSKPIDKNTNTSQAVSSPPAAPKKNDTPISVEPSKNSDQESHSNDASNSANQKEKKNDEKPRNGIVVTPKQVTHQPNGNAPNPAAGVGESKKNLQKDDTGLPEVTLPLVPPPLIPVLDPLLGIINKPDTKVARINAIWNKLLSTTVNAPGSFLEPAAQHYDIDNREIPDLLICEPGADFNVKWKVVYQGAPATGEPDPSGLGPAEEIWERTINQVILMNKHADQVPKLAVTAIGRFVRFWEITESKPVVVLITDPATKHVYKSLDISKVEQAPLILTYLSTVGMAAI